MQTLNIDALLASPLATILTFVIALVVFWLFFSVFNKKFNSRFRNITSSRARLACYLILILITIASLVGTNAISPWVWGASEALLLLLYLLIFRKGRVLHKVFWLFVTLTFYAISQVAASLFVDRLYEARLITLNGAAETLVATLFVLVVFGLICLVLIKQGRHSTEMSNFATLLFSIVPLVSCFLLIVWFRFETFFPSIIDASALGSVQTTLLLIAVLSLGAVNLVVLVLYDYTLTKAEENFEQRSLLREAEISRVHYEELKSLYQATRTWRHDYGNHLQVIETYVTSRNLVGLEEYLAELKGSLEQINFRIRTGNELLDALLNAKISYAETLGIQFSIEVSANMTDVGLSAVDASSLIGNLMDNAIEACLRIEDQEAVRRVVLKIIQTDKQLGIFMQNPVAELPEPHTDGSLTSSKKQGDHGIGTQQINAIVKRYKGHIQFAVNEGIFETYLVLMIQ